MKLARVIEIAERLSSHWEYSEDHPGDGTNDWHAEYLEDEPKLAAREWLATR